MEISAELGLEIQKLRQNSIEAEERLKKVGQAGAAAAQQANRAFAGVGRNVGRDVQTARIREASAAMARNNEHMAKFGAGLGGAAATVPRDSLLDFQTFKLLGGAAAGAGVVLGGSFVANSIKAAGALQDIELQIAKFSGGLEQAKALMAEGVELGVKTPFETDTIYELQASLLAAGDAAKDVMEDVRRLAAVAQDSQSLGDLGDIFGKGVTNRRFEWDGIKQFLDRRVNLLPSLEKVTGLDTQGLRKAISEGKIGIDEMRAALDDLRGPGGQFFGMMEARSRTLPGLWSTTASAINEASVAMGKASVGPLSDGLTLVVNDLMPRMISRAEEWGSVFADVNEYVLANLQELQISGGDTYWSGFVDDAEKALSDTGVMFAKWLEDQNKKLPDWMPGPGSPEKQRRNQERAQWKDAAEAWWIENVNLGYHRNIELPVARALNNGSEQTVLADIMKQTNLLGDVYDRMRARSAEMVAARTANSGDLRDIKEVPGGGVFAGGSGAAGQRNRVEETDYHMPGFQTGARSDLSARVKALESFNRSSREDPAAKPVPQSKPAGEQPDTLDQSKYTDEASSGTRTRYAVPGVMQQAMNRLANRSTFDLVAEQASEQTKLLNRLGRTMERIEKKMGEPVIVEQTGPVGRFSQGN